MSLGVTDYVNVCVHSALHPIQRIANLTPSVPGIGSGSTTTLTRTKQLLKIDG